MFRAYKYRLYPNKEQGVLLSKHFGSCRFIYNLALETKQMAYLGAKKNISCFDLINQMPELKKEYEWLKEVNSQSLNCSIINLDKGFTGFFKGIKKYPNFKNKHTKQSIQYPQNVEVNLNESFIWLPKFKKPIRAVIDRKFTGKVKTVTISRTPTGKYFASVLVDTGKANSIPKKIKEATAIGIDLGLKSFVATSSGESVGHPKYLRNSIDRLKVLQRRLSRKKKGSANKNKARHKVALLHEKIANQRKDFLHKLSTKLISENQTICIEDLNVKGMVKNHSLAQSISDSGWSEFVRQLKYKAEWNGRNILQIGRFEPSSKMCSSCGATNHVLTLADREWSCANCGAFHDRDVNAAKNIKAFALRNSPRGTRGVPVEMSAIAESTKQEYVSK